MKRINKKNFLITFGVSFTLSFGHLLLAHFNVISSASRAFPNAKNTPLSFINFITYLILIPFIMIFLYPFVNKVFGKKKNEDTFKMDDNKF